MTKHCKNCTCEDILADKQKSLEILKQELAALEEPRKRQSLNYSMNTIYVLDCQIHAHENKIEKLQEEISALKKSQKCDGTAKEGGSPYFQKKSSTDGCNEISNSDICGHILHLEDLFKKLNRLKCDYQRTWDTYYNLCEHIRGLLL